MSSPYQEAQRVGQDAVRAAFLDCAISLLVAEGPAALTMRRLASDVGSSTKVLYTMFGGKEGLVDALYREGFVRLRRTQEQVPRGEDPLAYLIELGRVYRESALAAPGYYRLMFERPVPGFQPSAEALAVAETAFGASASAVHACMEAGILRPGDAHESSKLFWAAAHGAVSLELAGHFAPAEAGPRYEALLAALGRAFSTRVSPTCAPPSAIERPTP
ncbi:TetR/AcrR family transcriptional regulator [Streptomyces hydrogenans]|uniref:TetR family transcriptional regulator n=1 Tax=Streptomyces hydrogenans TaxID=1873719 RepID=A0ABQ3PQ86_9ACTN|nr:TetR/AcrR family transcriptional regulator [Streptomyces hydrogenans]GHG45119.1 TetR family transcriptional regulator [Streptomyces hydrogenans]GHI27186.1 TetR family transcriptional regulator [Streptomyces hydrogenans]